MLLLMSFSPLNLSMEGVCRQKETAWSMMEQAIAFHGQDYLYALTYNQEMRVQREAIFLVRMG